MSNSGLLLFLYLSRATDIMAKHIKVKIQIAVIFPLEMITLNILKFINTSGSRCFKPIQFMNYQICGSIQYIPLVKTFRKQELKRLDHLPQKFKFIYIFQNAS